MHTHICIHACASTRGCARACTQRTRARVHRLACPPTRVKQTTHAHTHPRTHTCKHTCTCMHAHAHALRTYTHAHVCIRTHNAHACIRTHTREHTCTCARTRANTPTYFCCALEGWGHTPQLWVVFRKTLSLLGCLALSLLGCLAWHYPSWWGWAQHPVLISMQARKPCVQPRCKTGKLREL